MWRSNCCNKDYNYTIEQEKEIVNGKEVFIACPCGKEKKIVGADEVNEDKTEYHIYTKAIMAERRPKNDNLRFLQR